MGVGFAAVITILLAFVTFNNFSASTLRELQDEEVRRATDAIGAEELAGMGYKLYRIIAEAAINRNIEVSKKKWSIIKEEMDGDIITMKNNADTDNEKEWAREAQQHYGNIVVLFEEQLLPLIEKNRNLNSNDFWMTIRSIDTRIDEQTDKMIQPINNYCESLAEELVKADAEFDRIGVRTFWISIIATLLGLAFAIFIAVAITRSIVGPIRKIISSLFSGADQVAAASGQLASSSQQMSEGASEQASSLEEVSSSLEEMSSMTKNNADNAREANSVAQDASDASKMSATALNKMSDAIGKIQQSSDETAKIIKTIDEIAMQTNLLALNAAVEAARAGEAGRGFAVVAEEVRNLAQRSAEAAKNTAELIEGARKNAELGVNASKEVFSTNELIRQGVDKVSQLIAEVSVASQEQSQGIEQVNSAVFQMDTVTQRNAANAEESASASEELSSQAQQLNTLVDELVAIVKGVDKRSTGGQSGDFSQDFSGSRGWHIGELGKDRRHHGVSSRVRQVAIHSGREINPEKVLPLDDDENVPNDF
jgi:methyl-accepting chemotaxis protein